MNKIIAVATALTIALILTFSTMLPSAEAEAEFYPKLSIVTAKEKLGDIWIILCEDKEGNIWGFYDDDGEWIVGDIANLLMWNIGEREEEDELIEVYWEGHTNNIEMFFQVNGWR